MARSSFYPKSPRPPQIPPPAWEWYRPDERELVELESGDLEHVNRGGLLIRARTDREPVYHKLPPEVN